MQFTDKLFESSKDIWAGYLQQPFVKELGEGTLDLEKFRYYMIQDYRYLLQYAKVFALGVVKSRDEALMRRFAKMVNDTLDGEMKIHKAYMARLGITEEEVMNTPSHFINSAYTSYMLDEAFRGGVLEVITAVLSCAWSYQYIAAHLNEIPGAAAHPTFGEWVQGYTSEEYCNGTQDIIDVVNELGDHLSTEDEAHIIEIFVNCSIHEKHFWDMAYNMGA